MIRAIIIVPESEIDKANAALVAALGKEAQPDDSLTFIDGAKMSASGKLPASYVCCSAVYSPAQFTSVSSGFSAVIDSIIYTENALLSNASKISLSAAENGEGLILIKGDAAA